MQYNKKPKPPWWNYIKCIIKQYPALKSEMETAYDPKITSSLGSTGGHGGENSSPVERCVIHDLPPQKQIKLDAIEAAINEVKVRHPLDAADRLRLIDLVYWKQTNTIEGAAIKIPCHKNTAGVWQAEFVKLVAEELDLP